MSVATSTAKVSYTLTTGSQACSVPFYFLENAHIKAIASATLTLPEQELVLGTDYTLTGATNPAGGTLTTIATVGNGLASGSVITIKRDVPFTQEIVYTQNDQFPAKTHEKGLDKGTMLAQQLKEQADRAIRFPEDSTSSATLPGATDRASKVIGFDSTGEAITMKTPISGDGVLETEAVGHDVIQRDFRTRMVSTVAALEAMSFPDSFTSERIELLGYHSQGDGGGQLLVIDKTDGVTSRNGFTVFVASDGTRLKSVSRTWLNARHAGAKGDGVADDAARLQVYIDTISPTGDFLNTPRGADVWLPRGDYKVAAKLVLNPGCRVRGDGENATRIFSYVVNDDCLFFNADATAPNVCKPIKFSDFAILGKVASTGAYIRCMGVSDTHKPTFSDLYIYGANIGADGLRVNNSIQARVTCVTIQATSRDGYLFESSNNVSTFTSTYAISCGRHGYNYNGTQATFNSPASDSNGGDGYHIQGDSITFNSPECENCGAAIVRLIGTSGVVVNAGLLYGSSLTVDGFVLDGAYQTTLNHTNIRKNMGTPSGYTFVIKAGSLCFTKNGLNTEDFAAGDTDNQAGIQILNINLYGSIDAKNLSASGSVESGATILTRIYGTASLPSPANGLRAFVNDSNADLAAGLGNVVAAGGGNHIPVYADGSNWRIG